MPFDATWENDLGNFVYDEPEHGLVVRVLVPPKERFADKFTRLISANMIFELFLLGLFPVVRDVEKELVLLFESAELRDEFKHQVWKRITPWEVLDRICVEHLDNPRAPRKLDLLRDMNFLWIESLRLIIRSK